MKLLKSRNPIPAQSLADQILEHYSDEIVKLRQHKLRLTDLFEQYDKMLKGSILSRTVSSNEIKFRIADIRTEFILIEIQISELESTKIEFQEIKKLKGL